MKLESLISQNRFDILLEKMPSGASELRYTIVYGKSQLIKERCMMRNEPTERLSIQTPGLTARLTALCICVLMSTLFVKADTIAFPGAEGAGKFTKGGRGGPSAD